MKELIPTHELPVKRILKSQGVERPFKINIDRLGLMRGLSHKKSELKEKKAKIIREQNILSETQRLAHLGNWEWEIGTTTVHWSDEMYRIYGLAPQSKRITYEEYMSRVHPDDRELVDSVLWKGYQRKQPHEVFHRIVHDNGIVRTLLLRGAVVTNEKNIPVKMYGTAQDITEMKQMEEDLQKAKKELELKVEERTCDLANAIKKLEAEIAERARAQYELRYEKEKLQKYLNIAKVIFLVINKKFEVELINKKGCEITGYSEKEILGKNWLSMLVPPGFQNMVEKTFNLLLKDEPRSLESFESPIVTKNGEEKLIAWYNTVVRSGSGSIIGILGSGEDITEKKAAEKALKQSEEKYRKLVENMNEGILVVNNDDVIRFVNEKFCRIVEYSENELLGKTACRIFPDDSHKKFMHNKIGRRHRGLAGQYEIHIQTKSGNSVWILVNATPVYDENGNVSGSMGIYSDITERKKYEAEITKLSLALSKSENSIVITDSNGKIEWVNQGFERLTGYTLEEVQGTSGEVLKKGRPVGISKSTYHFRQLVKEKKSVSYESRNLSKNGREYWMFTTLTPILGPANEIEKIIAVDSDITLRKKTEEELLEAKKMAEESARSKETFLANMSHEIRTPMNAIMGIIQLLQDTSLTQLQKRYLHSVNFAATSLLRIINDILDLSKIGSGKLNFEEITFSPEEIVNGLVNTFSCNAREKNLLLTAELDKNLPELLLGDPVRLNQVLSNLVTNAIKFTPTGKITVRAKVRKKMKKAVRLEFEVEDSGIGIPAERQPHIFKEFEQADFETSRHYGGTGLGLAIVKRLVELQDGQVSVVSEKNKGSLFTVILDFGYAKKTDEKFSAPHIEKIPKDVSLKRTKVLLVEDNDLNQLVACQFLKNWGFRVDIAPDGRDAVNMLRKKNYDLVLMDIQMPEMNGYEATDYIRKKFKDGKQEIPILAMTAHAFRDEEEKCLNLGMDGYISKPLNRELLYQKIYSLIQKKKAGV